MNTSHFQFQKGFPKEAWIVIHTVEVVPVFTSGRINTVLVNHKGMVPSACFGMFLTEFFFYYYYFFIITRCREFVH